LPIKEAVDLEKFLGVYKESLTVERILPFITMRFNISSKFLKSNQMRNLMNQGNQKLVLIEV
jgi:hypothetical protein